MATRTIIASGNWSNPSIWENGQLPSDGDDVVHPAQYTVVLNTNTPLLNSYTLNGVLLLQSSGGVNFAANSLSGNGALDLQPLSNPQNAFINPCKIYAHASGASLNLTSLSNFLNYYTLIFPQTFHGLQWDMDNFQIGKLFPTIVSANSDGNNNLILTLSAQSNTPAAQWLVRNNNTTHSVLCPRNISGSPVNALLHLRSGTLVGNTFTIPGAGGEASSVVAGASLIPIFHNVMCPILLERAHLPTSVTLTGIVVGSNCTANGVLNIGFGILGSVLDVRAEILIYSSSVDARRVLDVSEALIWCPRYA